MKIKDLPQEIKELALSKFKEQELTIDENLNINTSIDDGGFDWFETSEGIAFWLQISKGNFAAYYALYYHPKEPNNIEVISEEVVKENYDFINPNHYKKFSIEVIDMMVSVWGKEATAIHCEMCAFKYRLRMGEKPDQPIERDLEKVNWYLNKAKELMLENKQDKFYNNEEVKEMMRITRRNEDWSVNELFDQFKKTK